VRRLFEETEKALGSPSVLVNNAGVFQFEPFEAITEREFHREFDTNVLGPILTIQEALKQFPASGGSIINISSIASENPVPNSSLYSATKGAVDTLTMALAKELGPRNIRVNTVAPVTPTLRARGESGMSAASRLSRWFRKPRWVAGSRNPRRSLRSLCSLPQTTRRG
jgi:NAD(P)-dependent dehydrogenase (short-subunit alcohol dehydrogenase family)